MRAQGGKEASGSGESERDFLGMASSSNESRASLQRQPRRSGRGTVSSRSFQAPLGHEAEGGDRDHQEREHIAEEDGPEREQPTHRPVMRGFQLQDHDGDDDRDDAVAERLEAPLAHGLRLAHQRAAQSLLHSSISSSGLFCRSPGVMPRGTPDPWRSRVAAAPPLSSTPAGPPPSPSSGKPTVSPRGALPPTSASGGSLNGLHWPAPDRDLSATREGCGRGQLSVKAFAGSSRAAARAGRNAPRRAASSATPMPSARCPGWKVKKVAGLKGNSGRPVRAS